MRRENGDTPATGYDGPDNNELGLTKREAFAKAAMQGICASYDPLQIADDGADARICAGYAVEHADALLAALEES